MSDEVEGVVLPSDPTAAFAALMDVMAPEPEAAEAAPDTGAGGATGLDAGAGNGAGGAPGTGAAPVAGVNTAADLAGAGGAVVAPGAGGAAGNAAGDPTGAGGGTAGSGGGHLPATWTASSAELIPKFSELSTKFEETILQTHQATALEEVQAEYPKYFEALQKPARLLVGKSVPKLEGDGEEVLRDSADAKDWQDSLKEVLVQEVRDRSTRAMEDQQGFIETVHASIKLFQDNAELIPGSKDFDLDLANRFASLAKPYELRVEGKLNGYTIPVQPLIDSLRDQLKAERATNPGASSPAAGAVQQSPPAAGPQAGIQSKAGSSDSSENFDTLFGTLGIGPGFRI